MLLDDFNKMSDDEKSLYLESVANNESTILNLEAERNSYAAENKTLSTQLNDTLSELKTTKELNYTLSRKINITPEHTTEELLLKLTKEI